MYKRQAQDSYIPNISPNIPGGILLLEVSGDCWADGGTADVACFTGFGTVDVSKRQGALLHRGRRVRAL